MESGVVKLFIILMLSNLSFADNSALWIVGNWEYFMKIYQNVEMPKSPSDPQHLNFDFTDDGVSHLYWWNEETGYHCNRKGEFSIEGELLIDKVMWVDPTNSFGCSSDPDMQEGKITKTRVFLKDHHLYLELNLGNEPLYYVLKNRGE